MQNSLARIKRVTGSPPNVDQEVTLSSGLVQCMPAKIVQERLGHASIVMTMDRYGHPFPNDVDGGELEAAELALIG
jgi:integrase